MNNSLIPAAYYAELAENHLALILDGFINGYGILRALTEVAEKSNDCRYVVVAPPGAMLSRSKLIDFYLPSERIEETHQILMELNQICQKTIVPYYCKDSHLSLIIRERQRLDKFSIPWIDTALFEKVPQQELARSEEIPVPKSIAVDKVEKLTEADQLEYPVIVKPILQKEGGAYLFKAEICQDDSTRNRFVNLCLENDAGALVSEYIPGGDDHLYTFGGYAYQGRVIAPFTGRKLAQRPHLRGVASVAEPIIVDEIVRMGERFIAAADFTGIFQIEFKYHQARNRYYFIEFNPRNWSWAFIATLNGINVPKAKLEAELGKHHEPMPNGQKEIYYYLWGEGALYNLLIDKWAGIIRVLFGKSIQRGSKVHWPVFNARDSRPFFQYVANLISFAIGKRSTLR